MGSRNTVIYAKLDALFLRIGKTTIKQHLRKHPLTTTVNAVIELADGTGKNLLSSFSDNRIQFVGKVIQVRLIEILLFLVVGGTCAAFRIPIVIRGYRSRCSRRCKRCHTHCTVFSSPANSIRLISGRTKKSQKFILRCHWHFGNKTIQYFKTKCI